MSKEAEELIKMEIGDLIERIANNGLKFPFADYEKRAYEIMQSYADHQLKAKMPSDEYVKKLEFMIDNGLGWNDLKNDI